MRSVLIEGAATAVALAWTAALSPLIVARAFTEPAPGRREPRQEDAEGLQWVEAETGHILVDTSVTEQHDQGGTVYPQHIRIDEKYVIDCQEVR